LIEAKEEAMRLERMFADNRAENGRANPAQYVYEQNWMI
jgi:hypothetical protein